MGEMVHTGSKYTDEDRMNAVVLYATKGTGSAVSRETGIPETTISLWRKSDWWEGAIAEVRSEKQDVYIAQYDKLITEGNTIALEKLPEASARDAMIIAATANDKLRLCLNQPTTIKGESDSIKTLAAQFAKLSADHRTIQSTVVSVQDKDDINQE